MNGVLRFALQDSDDAGPGEGHRDAFRLQNHLMRIAIDQTGFSGTANGLHGINAGQDGAEDAAETVNAPDVQRVVIAEHMLKPVTPQ